MSCEAMDTCPVSEKSFQDTENERQVVNDEVVWGLSYRNLKQSVKSNKILHPKKSPINIPFEICRAKQHADKKVKREDSIKNRKNKSKKKKEPKKLTMLDRNTMSQAKYMDYLAIPVIHDVKLPEIKKKKKCCRCELVPCSPRLTQLAVPNKRRVYENWKGYYDRMPAEIILRYENMLHVNQNVEPQEARCYFKKLDRIKRQQLKRKRKLAKKKKQEKLKGDKLWLKDQIKDTATTIVNFVQNEPLFDLNYKQLMISDEIFDKLKQRKMVKKPNRKSKSYYKKVKIEIADKVAVWIDTITRFVDVQAIESDEDIPPLEISSLEEFGLEGEEESTEVSSSEEEEEEEEEEEDEEDRLREWGEEEPWSDMERDKASEVGGLTSDEEKTGEGEEADLVDESVRFADELLKQLADEEGQKEGDELQGDAREDEEEMGGGAVSDIEGMEGVDATDDEEKREEEEVRQEEEKDGDDEDGPTTGEDEEEKMVEEGKIVKEIDDEGEEPRDEEQKIIEEKEDEKQKIIEEKEDEEQKITEEKEAEKEKEGEEEPIIEGVGDEAKEEAEESAAGPTDEEEELSQGAQDIADLMDQKVDEAQEEEEEKAFYLEGEEEEEGFGISPEEGSEMKLYEEEEAEGEGEKEEVSVIYDKKKEEDAAEKEKEEAAIIKGHKPSKVLEHSPDTVCCLSLKIWAVWLLEITHNAHNWTKWIGDVIKQVREFAATIRGDVVLPNGEKKVLYKEDWRKFSQETEEQIIAWRQYSAHVKDLSNNIISNYNNKNVHCCPKCLQDNLIKDVVVVHDTLQSLTEAMNCAGYWRRTLDELVNQTGKLAGLDEAAEEPSTSSEDSDKKGGYIDELDPNQQKQISQESSVYEIEELDPNVAYYSAPQGGPQANRNSRPPGPASGQPGPSRYQGR